MKSASASASTKRVVTGWATASEDAKGRGVTRLVATMFIMRRPPPTLSEDDAINLAAWLVALVDDGEAKFAKTIAAVKNT